MREAARLSARLQQSLVAAPVPVVSKGGRKLCWLPLHQARCRFPAVISARQRGVLQHSCLTSAAAQEPALVQECSDSDWNTPLLSQPVTDGPVSVALGKFDGMHQGHRLLAERAAASGAYPHLLSFSGMAEVLGWPARLPLVAPDDRARVLSTWKPFCHGRTPRQRFIPFSMVRNLSPEAFVKVLAQDLQVSGVVVGQNYRFGYKAAGDSNVLLKLGAEYGLNIDIVSLVEASAGGVEGQVSSSKIRDALNQGLMQQVAESLDRPYRLMANITTAELALDQDKVRVPLKHLLNQPPQYNKLYTVSMLIRAQGNTPESPTPDSPGEVYVDERGLELSKELSEVIRQHMPDTQCLLSMDFL